MSGSVDKLKQQTGLQKKPGGIIDMIQAMKPQIAMALPKHLNAERVARVAMTAIRTTPKLAQCEPQSVIASVMLASQLGWEIGVQGQCYLVPYKNKQGQLICQLIPGWKGLLDLVHRTGRVTCHTQAVHKGDVFEVQRGTEPKITHLPADDDTGEVTHVYAVAIIEGFRTPLFEVWSMAKVKRHLNRYNRVGADHYALKDENNLEMYARKAVLLQLIKYLPQSIELLTAANLDYSGETGGQKLTIDGVRQAAEGAVYFDIGETAEGAIAAESGADSAERARAAEMFQLLGIKPSDKEKFIAERNEDWSRITADLEAELDREP